MRKEKLKYSITGKITVIMVGMVAGTALLCWVLNNTLLEHYYITNKQKSLQRVYERTASAVETGTLYGEAAEIELERLCAKDNIGLTFHEFDSLHLPSGLLRQLRFVEYKPVDNVFFLFFTHSSLLFYRVTPFAFSSSLADAMESMPSRFLMGANSFSRTTS